MNTWLKPQLEGCCCVWAAVLKELLQTAGREQENWIYLPTTNVSSQALPEIPRALPVRAMPLWKRTLLRNDNAEHPQGHHSPEIMWNLPWIYGSLWNKIKMCANDGVIYRVMGWVCVLTWSRNVPPGLLSPHLCCWSHRSCSLWLILSRRRDDFGWNWLITSRQSLCF